MNKQIILVSKLALALAGLAAFTALPTPARAFDFSTQAGQMAGNPAGQQLYQVGIDASDVGNTFPVRWRLPATGRVSELLASANFTVVELTRDRLVLEVQVENATAASFQAAITSFGFGISPSATGVDLVAIEGNTATFDRVLINERQQNFPGGFKDINVCVIAANNCSGGAIREGLQSGGSTDTFQIILTGNFGTQPSLTLTSFPVKFQTEAGSYELAGMFSSTPVAESMDDDDDDDDVASEMEDDDDNDSATLPTSVSTAVLREISTEYNVAITDLEVVEYRRETWSNGCLGLGGADQVCTEALVPGWRVLVASQEEVWVYRTNTSGTLVVFDQVATETQRVALRRESRVTQRVTETVETVRAGQSQSAVEVRQGSSSTSQVTAQRVELSQTVQSAVLQTIARQARVEASSLQLVEVRQMTWSNSCLGLPQGGNCAQALVPGYLMVVSNGQQTWVCRTNESGSVVLLDERATAMRREQRRVRSTNISFTDVSSTYWASQFIRELAALDIIAGYPDGAYRPDRPVTRAEFAAIIRRAFEVAEIRDAVVFVDVEQEYWAYNAIEEAYEMGFLSTFSQNQFRPLAQLTRADALFAIARGLRLSSSSTAESLLSMYREVNVSAENRPLLLALTEQGIVVNYPERTVLNLERVATRAEVAAFVYQTLSSLGYVEQISSPYIVRNASVIQNPANTNSSGGDRPRQNCNQGIGNGAEGCDPGNSSPRGGSNDEGGRTPGGR